MAAGPNVRNGSKPDISQNVPTYMKRLYDAGRLGQSRVFLGTTRSKASALVLNDSKGRARLQLMVQADGQPVIQMLDEAGKVVKTVGIAD